MRAHQSAFALGLGDAETAIEQIGNGFGSKADTAMLPSPVRFQPPVLSWTAFLEMPIFGS